MMLLMIPVDAGDGDRAVWILVLLCIVACCLLLVANFANRRARPRY